MIFLLFSVVFAFVVCFSSYFYSWITLTMCMSDYLATLTSSLLLSYKIQHTIRFWINRIYLKFHENCKIQRQKISFLHTIQRKWKLNWETSHLMKSWVRTKKHYYHHHHHHVSCWNRNLNSYLIVVIFNLVDSCLFGLFLCSWNCWKKMGC